MAELRVISLCPNCPDPGIGEPVEFTSADFDFCAVCGNFTRTNRSKVVRVSDPIAETPSEDPALSRDGGSYAFHTRVVVG